MKRKYFILLKRFLHSILINPMRLLFCFLLQKYDPLVIIIITYFYLIKFLLTYSIFLPIFSNQKILFNNHIHFTICLFIRKTLKSKILMKKHLPFSKILYYNFLILFYRKFLAPHIMVNMMRYFILILLKDPECSYYHTK